MSRRDDPSELGPVRERLHEIIFEADTPLGRIFDIGLFGAIVASVIAVMLESVEAFAVEHGALLRGIEWCFTLLFTGEYALRMFCVRRPWSYATSFFGVVDLLAILPTYLSLFVVGTQSLLVIRVLRLLRIFRVFKMARYLGEANILLSAVQSSARKVAVFVGTVLTLVVIIGAVMYLVEGGRDGFESIPAGIYWAIVTLTTVGYGDVAPATVPGRAFASTVMILGYGIIAVPTGIVTVELQAATRRSVSRQACRDCSKEGHDADSKFCKYCGAEL